MRDRIPRRISTRVTGRVVLGKRTFLLMDRLGTHGERYRAFAPDAGPDGDDRVIHILPKSKTSLQHIGVLKRLSQGTSITNLPVIHEYHAVRDKIYVVLPWVRGRSLREHLDGARRVDNKGHKGISTKEAVKLFLGFGHALAHLNRHKNMVHGDLKPENLIVHARPNRLVMIDFGSAWLVERTKSRGPRDGLDRQYSAPELHAGGIADFRADVFSACAIFYAMLTLEIPYDGIGGQAGLEQFRATYNDTYVPPSKKCRNSDIRSSSVWNRIDHLIGTGLQLDPDRRYQNWTTWRDDVEAIRSELMRPDEPSVGARAAMAIIRPLNWLRGR